MMNTLMKESPNPVARVEEHPIHNAENEDERSPKQNGEDSHGNIEDPNSPPLGPVVLIVRDEERFDPFRPIHPQCNHISY